MALNNSKLELLKKKISYSDNLQHNKAKEYSYYSLSTLAELYPDYQVEKLPFSMRVVLENLVRNSLDDKALHSNLDILQAWLADAKNHEYREREINFRPSRVLLQDFTGIPLIVDLATMRDAAPKFSIDPAKVNPHVPVDLVIDHSVQVDDYAHSNSLFINNKKEMERNFERYEFLKWGQESFDNFRLVPPGTGICHQINLEYLAKVVFLDSKNSILYPETIVGTDSHTTMINALAVLGWGVGGIEAEAVMLSQPISMVMPEVVGFKFNGKLRPHVTATDLVLTVTQILRQINVVGKFVEFGGPGLSSLTLADRATIANMAPEYGATCGFFPIDTKTIEYLRLTGREENFVDMVEKYAQENLLWSTGSEELYFNKTITLDLDTVEPSLAGPKRPQDRVSLSGVTESFIKVFPKATRDKEVHVVMEHPALVEPDTNFMHLVQPTPHDNFFSKSSGEYQSNKMEDMLGKGTHSFSKVETSKGINVGLEHQDFKLHNGDFVIAAITSCTNTSNPYVLIGAGLMARKAVELGLHPKPWVKTSFAPGSPVVAQYMKASGLQDSLDQLGFNVVGFGCTTCIGNSGPLKPEIEDAILHNDLFVASILSGNRNFEGRIHPSIKANYLASPLLVVAFSIVGNLWINIESEPLGISNSGREVYLKDIWPNDQEICDQIKLHVTDLIFKQKYRSIFDGDELWQKIKIEKSSTYSWNPDSTYVRRPPYFDGCETEEKKVFDDIKDARILAILGDSITTDHISPAGSIKLESPAGMYLLESGVKYGDFNSYGARRGNHEVMMRGTFANIRLRNEMVETEGGYTVYYSNDEKTEPEEMTIFEASQKYIESHIPLVVVAGREYGSGSSRDWAAKGPFLLGVRVVIAESFERIHRSNLVGMGIMPLHFLSGETRKTHNIEGSDILTFPDFHKILAPGQRVQCHIQKSEGHTLRIELICAVKTDSELRIMKKGGIMKKVLLDLA